MAVRREVWRDKPAWVIDFRTSDGRRVRERSPEQSKRGARAYELQRIREERERAIYQVSEPAAVPTFRRWPGADLGSRPKFLGIQWA